MYCRKCGKEITNGSTFCCYCGTDLTKYKIYPKNNIIIFFVTLSLVIICGIILSMLFSNKQNNKVLVDNKYNENDLALNDTNIKDNSDIMDLDDVHYYISNISDDSYSVKQVYYYNGTDGSYIHDDDKFWIRANYQNSNNDVFEKYILIDASGIIYKMMPTDESIDDTPADMLFSVAEDVIMISRHGGYQIIDITGSSKDYGNFNDITSRYLDDGEDIWTVQYDDSGLNIFTVSLVDTYSYQDMIFNIYDSSMNLKFSFSKSELVDKYGIWHWDNNNLNLESLGGCIYGIKASNNGSHDALYIETKRNKEFISGKVFKNMYFIWSSNGHYILCTGGYSGDDYLLINIDREVIEYDNTVEVALSDIGESSWYYNTSSLMGFSDVSENFCYAYSIYGGTRHYVLLQFEAVAINSILMYNGSTVTNFSEFHNGMSILELENSGGTKFITMLQCNGEWQFEPISGCIDSGVYYLDEVEKFLVFSNDLNTGYLIGDNGLEQEIDNISAGDTFFHVINRNNKYQIICLDKMSNSLKYIDI